MLSCTPSMMSISPPAGQVALWPNVQKAGQTPLRMNCAFVSSLRTCELDRLRTAAPRSGGQVKQEQPSGVPLVARDTHAAKCAMLAGVQRIYALCLPRAVHAHRQPRRVIAFHYDLIFVSNCCKTPCKCRVSVYISR